ncbi:MAG: permease [Candidatus Peribacteraceae bacterium]|nr:permease [Candidatus Peribacteraceae bacterium]
MALSADRWSEIWQFFVYDTVKIFVLLTVIVFIVTFLRSYLPPQRIKTLLTHRFPLVGYFLAASIGVVTPFCSCSAIPLFLGLVESGVPLGVTFSYLVSAPMVNEVAAVLLLGLFGWKAMMLYIGSGVLLAVITGFILGQLHLEHLLILTETRSAASAATVPSTRERLERAGRYTRNLLRNIFPYVLLGVGAGAFIHGYAPANLLAQIAGRGNPFAVPIAVLIGVPLYSNAAGTIPIVQSLIEKGLPMGTALAFMMAITALSVPEMIILRRVMKTKLLALYVTILSVGIIFTGYLFNVVL